MTEPRRWGSSLTAACFFCSRQVTFANVGDPDPMDEVPETEA